MFVSTVPKLAGLALLHWLQRPWLAIGAQRHFRQGAFSQADIGRGRQGAASFLPQSEHERDSFESATDQSTLVGLLGRDSLEHLSRRYEQSPGAKLSNKLRNG